MQNLDKNRYNRTEEVGIYWKSLKILCGSEEGVCTLNDAFCVIYCEEDATHSSTAR